MSRWTFGTGPVGLGMRDRSRLERALAAALGAEIEVRPFLTYTELLDAVVMRTVQLAWVGPAVFVRARERCEVEALVSVMRESGSSYRAALFVRESSTLRSVTELAGARIAWVDPSACAGYLYPRLAMIRAGVDTDALGTERFVGSYGATVRAVEAGVVDVGAGYVELERPDDPASRVLRAAWTDTPLDARPILITDPVPADVILATRAIGREDRDRIRDALRTVHRTAEGAAALRDLFRARALGEIDLASYEMVANALGAAGEKL